ncbi:unnamed protein product [Leptosia nina]|uniref:Uncharacterized protein n=1 Tax=Leptosia nina TaxID=320188 RepID=A0AAV1JCK3_9NEOP
MPKLGPVFLIASTAIILLSFGALCYLMKSVNPKAKAPETGRRLISIDAPFLTELLHSDNLDYGLEKVPDMTTITITEKSFTKSRLHSFSSGDAVQSLVPPVFQVTEIITNNTHEANISKVLAPVKGQRRSIREHDELLIDEIPSSLILNIVDHDGYSKVIIKLGAARVDKKRSRKRSFNNKKSSSLKKDNSNDYNKTVIVLDLTESNILNIIGDSLTLGGLNDVEFVMTNNELELQNISYSNSTDFLHTNKGTFKELREELYQDDNTNGTNSLNLLAEGNLTNVTDFQAYESVTTPINKLTLENNTLEATENIESNNNVTRPSDQYINEITSTESILHLLIKEETLKNIVVNENDPFPSSQESVTEELVTIENSDEIVQNKI